MQIIESSIEYGQTYTRMACIKVHTIQRHSPSYISHCIPHLVLQNLVLQCQPPKQFENCSLHQGSAPMAYSLHCQYCCFLHFQLAMLTVECLREFHIQHMPNSFGYHHLNNRMGQGQKNVHEFVGGEHTAKNVDYDNQLELVKQMTVFKVIN